MNWLVNVATVTVETVEEVDAEVTDLAVEIAVEIAEISETDEEVETVADVPVAHPLAERPNTA